MPVAEATSSQTDTNHMGTIFRGTLVVWMEPVDQEIEKGALGERG
jgi:acyl-CoA hydrolase